MTPHVDAIGGRKLMLTRLSRSWHNSVTVERAIPKTIDERVIIGLIGGVRCV